MNILIAIIEDESIYAQQLTEMLEHWAKQLNCTLTLDYFKNASSFLQTNFNSYDVAFLDIQLDETMDGLSLAQFMRKGNYQGSIIFLTSYKEYVFQGYDVQALHYLLKPVKEQDIKKCMNMVYQLTKENNYIIQSNSQTIKIPYHQILYFSSANHYIEVYMSEISYSHKAKLSDMISHLPYHFAQCHRSILVNMNHVEKIVKNEIFLSNGAKLPISNTYLEDVRKTFLDTIL
ncbi:LytR/AlgR family response regulator transcription factor [Anaerotignum sp.]|uniref:LytR/AlgR family response regulator transcription factor n=1 Tax=Anaerotignum sp. TaxID=2039241 RepID=UPI0028B1415E|nr:LytTR family DNA-binding domain-containing protein [Anaerotignum sp.]